MKSGFVGATARKRSSRDAVRPVIGGLLVAFLLAVESAGCGGAETSQRIAYASIYHDSSLYIMNIDGSGRALLTDSDGGRDRESPAWSPDGRKIAFVVEERGRRVGIDVMNADGRGVRELTRHPYDDAPTWSPDGREIAFVRWFEELDGQVYSRIYVVSLADHDVRPLMRMCTASCDDRDPAWSPDGRMIAITRRGPTEYLPSGFAKEHSWIYVLRADGTGARRLTHEPPSEDPAWSPDGRMIAFERKGADDPGGPTHSGLAIMNADGTGVRQLTSWGFNPAWSPDGRKIAFTRGADIYVINVDGSGERVLEADGGTQPAWAPGER